MAKQKFNDLLDSAKKSHNSARKCLTKTCGHAAIATCMDNIGSFHKVAGDVIDELCDRINSSPSLLDEIEGADKSATAAIRKAHSSPMFETPYLRVNR